MTAHVLFTIAGILAALAIVGAGWMALARWAERKVRRAYRDAGVPYDEPLPPEWVNDSPRVCPPRARRHAYRDRCGS